MTAPQTLLRLMWLASPALPVGGFSYSEGLESAVDAGQVGDEAQAGDWLVAQLRLSQARSDLALAAQAHRAWREGDTARVAGLNDWVLATRESAELLGLTEQLALVLLCKAAAVRIAARIKAAEGVNVLEGVVARVGTARQDTELTLELPGGLQLVGFAAQGHGLKPGMPAQAAVEASSLVLAL